jgi:hypothetical protein
MIAPVTAWPIETAFMALQSGSTSHKLL